MKLPAAVPLVMLTVTLCGCGGNSSIPTPQMFTIGGSVSALSGAGLILQDNGVDNLPVVTNGTFTFPTKLPSGHTYKVTVSVQPSSPVQTCVVTGGSGTVSGSVTNIVVNCGQSEWVWESGSSSEDQGGSYGALGVPAPTNVPGARQCPVVWSDSAGNLWMFGGGQSQTVGLFNDLWEYGAGEWTWVSGSNLMDQNGTYGTQGIPAPTNVPGGRCAAVGWKSPSGDLWLFGGSTTGPNSLFNDLWRYSSGEWTWMSGANSFNEAGIYGTKGVPDPSNVPGARLAPVSWTDPAGDFWLFGGIGQSAAVIGTLNDLWRYSAGEWTWMGGSNSADEAGTYGTQGVPSPTNVPGARFQAAAWTDTQGNFWIFGGEGRDKDGVFGLLNDLWEFSGGQWIWVSGSNVNGQTGVYGTLGMPAPSNVPGARFSPTGWVDAKGDFWLFGGAGFDSTGANGDLNDLWRFSGGQWTWMGGANVKNQTGSYGTLGTPALSNIPKARSYAVGWTDAIGNLWLFGGNSFDGTGTTGNLNDLWKYEP